MRYEYLLEPSVEQLTAEFLNERGNLGWQLVQWHVLPATLPEDAEEGTEPGSYFHYVFMRAVDSISSYNGSSTEKSTSKINREN